ncbi:primase zinc finger domain-containing protein [Sarocladium implicatum]|nr:primase zinc finger domain-containing protein [Sarocladium implicatum]
MSSTGYLRKARTPAPSSDPACQPMSFNERLASVRTEEVERAQRRDHIQKSRTETFGIGQQEIDRYKSEAVDLPAESSQTPTYSREEILGKPATAGGLKQSRTVPNLRSPQKQNGSKPDADESSASFEAYSGFHLSRRILPHNVLARHMSGKKTYGLKELLREVKSPDWDLPDVDQDVVVMAIVAQKSEPRLHKNGVQRKNEEPRKYMVVTLVDLQWELELLLFNSGFERYWKLTEGTVIGLLNPTILAPRKGQEATGRFTLCLNSDDDTVIEIGQSRDLGFCQSVKKDGQLCMAWTNKKRTQFCEYHTNAAVNKQRGSRVEMNNSSFGPRKAHTNSYEVHGWGKRQGKDKNDKGAGKYDHDSSSRYFMSRTMSAADLIDGKDLTAVDKKERAEFVKRKLEAKEREDAIIKKLGEKGAGAGKEYMNAAAARRNQGDVSSQSDGRVRSSQTSIGFPQAPSTAPAPFIEPRRRDQAIQLGAVKRKRADSALSGLPSSSRLTSRSRAATATPSSGSSMTPKPAGFGWGGDLKGKLSRMRDGEKLRKEQEILKQRQAARQEKLSSPVRKKTRFVTEKGIREAGRESLGTELAGRQLAFDDDDDDDELVVV